MGTLDSWPDGLPDPPADHQFRVRADGGHVTFTMPPNWRRTAVLLLVLALPLAFAVMASIAALWVGAAEALDQLIGSMMALLGAVGTLPQTVRRLPPAVDIDRDGLTLTHKFLWPFRASLPGEDISFVHVAQPQAYLGGKMPGETSGKDELQMEKDDSRVVIGAGHTLFAFGDKLSRAEKEWIEDCISRVLWPAGAPDPELPVPRPHERFARWALHFGIVLAAVFAAIGLVLWFGRDFGGLSRLGGVLALLAGAVGFGVLIRYLGEARRYRSHEQALRDLAGPLDMNYILNDTVKRRFAGALPNLSFLRANTKLCSVLTHRSRPEIPLAFNYTRGARLFRPHNPLWRRSESRLAPRVKPARFSFACVLDLPATGVTQMHVGPRSASHRLWRGLLAWLAPGRPPSFSQSYKVRIRRDERPKTRTLLPPDLQRELADWAVHNPVPEVYILPNAIAFDVSRADALSGKEEVHDFLRRAVRCRQTIAKALAEEGKTTESDEDPEWLATASVSVSD